MISHLYNAATILNRAGSASVICGITILIATGCDFREPRWRSYEEINSSEQPAHIHDSSGERTQKPPEKPSLAWTIPDGWSEQAGSGMRLATLMVTSDTQNATCTLVSLGGSAGGLEANVKRWIGQLGLPIPDADAMTAFLKRQLVVESSGGFSGTVVDLSELGVSSDGTTMLAALIDLQGSMLFIKFTGPAELLSAQKEHFVGLCRSFRRDS